MLSRLIFLGLLVSHCLFAASAYSQTEKLMPLEHRDEMNYQPLPAPASQDCPETQRSLTQVKGDIWRHTSGNDAAVHSGIVLMTTEGAVVIDPAMTCTAKWLLNEIENKHHTHVKYVIYTHAHFDHIAGSGVFTQAGAKVIAQENATSNIIDEKLPVPLPDLIFKQHAVLNFGGHEIDLIHVAPSHSNSMTLVLFDKSQALQCTDVCQNNTFPYNDFLDFYYDGWVNTLDWVLKKDNLQFIDIGHYTPTSLTAIQAERDYMVSLHHQVRSLIVDGKSWDELYRLITYTPEQKKWFGYDQMRILNTLGMYRWVSNHRRGVW
jgi:glyoxylase-like metal-dependent hydrolase (beta-lactamase superfamily II)